MKCAEVRQLLSEYADRALDAKTTRALEAHLARCDSCRLHLDELRRVIAELKDLPLHTAPVGILDRVSEEAKRQFAAVETQRFLPRLAFRLGLAAAVLILAVGIVLRLRPDGGGKPRRERQFVSRADVPEADKIKAEAPVAMQTAEMIPDEALSYDMRAESGGGGVTLGDEERLRTLLGKRELAGVAGGMPPPAREPVADMELVSPAIQPSDLPALPASAPTGAFAYAEILNSRQDVATRLSGAGYVELAAIVRPPKELWFRRDAPVDGLETENGLTFGAQIPVAPEGPSPAEAMSSMREGRVRAREPELREEVMAGALPETASPGKLAAKGDVAKELVPGPPSLENVANVIFVRQRANELGMLSDLSQAEAQDCSAGEMMEKEEDLTRQRGWYRAQPIAFERTSLAMAELLKRLRGQGEIVYVYHMTPSVPRAETGASEADRKPVAAGRALAEVSSLEEIHEDADHAVKDEVVPSQTSLVVFIREE